MIYVNDNDKLTADEVQVAAGNQVEQLVVDGWRILAVMDSTMPDGKTISRSTLFTPLFVMGRSEGDASLNERMLAAQAAATAAQICYDEMENGEVVKLRNQVDALQKEAENNQTAMDRTITSLDGARGKLTALEQEVGKVRTEIGEGRWREIMGSLEVEQIMDGTAPTDDDDSVPF